MKWNTNSWIFRIALIELKSLTTFFQPNILPYSFFTLAKKGELFSVKRLWKIEKKIVQKNDTPAVKIHLYEITLKKKSQCSIWFKMNESFTNDWRKCGKMWIIGKSSYPKRLNHSWTTLWNFDGIVRERFDQWLNHSQTIWPK